jgi:feruloyl esterase
MVPGVQHCLGGTGPDSFGQLNAPGPSDTPKRSVTAAVQAWVEDKQAPDSIVGRRGLGGLMGIPAMGPERQRLLCPWPSKEALQPGGDPDQATSYTCQPADRK